MAGVEDLVNSLQKKFGKEVVAGNNQQGVEFVSSGSLSLDWLSVADTLSDVLLNCVGMNPQERPRWL